VEIAGFWIIATIASVIIAIFSIIINIALWLVGRREGRYMISRGFGGKGVDLLLVEPSSNNIELKNITWEGDIWKEGKEGMMVNLDLLSNPETPSDKLYNDLIKNTGQWSGNKRPVIMATPIMSTILPPGVIAAVNKGEAQINSDLIKKYVRVAEQHGLEVITHLQAISPAEIKKYLKDVGPKNIRDSFLKGVEAEKLANSKPPGERALPGGMWVMLFLMALALIAGLYVITQTDILKGIM
jgi:hypothetical protein